MRIILCVLLTLVLFLTACSPVIEPVQHSESIAKETNSSLTDEASLWRIRLTDTDGNELQSFSRSELTFAENFTHIYSTINNWPTSRYYAAEGIAVTDILETAGLLDTMQTVTFRAADGYEVSFTREQLLSEQFYYPHVGENDDGAKPVVPLIAYRWREGSSDLKDLREDKPCLIIGQRSAFEQTNPAFVVGVAEIMVSSAPCETWPMATTFPLPGSIATGETVKLQHANLGQVKLYYTLDGSDPTVFSPMYNPSTYQPELTKPIPITEETVIKILACGFGRTDSEIAEYKFIPQS